MSAPEPYDPYEETVVPRAVVSFPAKLPIPTGFAAERPETWPRIAGRLEFVEGALWFMPPTGGYQQSTATDVTTELNLWRRQHPDFIVGSNEAGMLLGGEVRAADGAVWRRSDLGADPSHRLPRVPPVLAVEIAGRDETIEILRSKARWYLEHGVQVVWIVDPATRTVVTITSRAEATFGSDDTVPEHPSLPDLSPNVEDFFRQLDRA